MKTYSSFQDLKKDLRPGDLIQRKNSFFSIFEIFLEFLPNEDPRRFRFLSFVVKQSGLSVSYKNSFMVWEPDKTSFVYVTNFSR